MTGKYLAALVAVCIAAPAIPQEAIPTPFFITEDVIPQIFCAKPDSGGWTGTGVIISATRVISARHVTDGVAVCAAEKQYLLKATTFDGDFASNTATLPAQGQRMIVGCEGIKEGEIYLAAGYAFGGGLVVAKLVGTDMRDGEFVRMQGRVYSGMSGGPVVDDEGRVVAIVNQKFNDISHANVHPLSETYLCKHS